MLYVIILAAAVMLPSGGTLAFFLTRETRRLRAFDRRLAVSRAVVLKSGSSPTVGGRRQRPAAGLFRELVLTIVRSASVVAPFGAKEREKLTKMLRNTGFHQPDALSVYLCIKLASGLVGGTAAGIAAATHDVLSAYVVAVPLLFLVGAVLGGLLPETLIRARNSRRNRRVAEALPNALDLLVMSLEAGLTFERALLSTADELSSLAPGLAAELRGLEAELRVGSDHRTVLRDFQHRSEVEGLRDLATSLLQAERYGTPLTHSMRNIAESERTQRAARIEEQVQRLPVYMTLPMMLLVLPGIMLLMAGPAFLQAIEAMTSIG